MTTLELACSCAADGRYAPHSAAMLHSVLAHSDEVHVRYLTGPGFPAEARRLITEMVEGSGGAISFYEIADEQVEGLPELDHVPRSLWYRIFLPDLLPECERALYLDLDVIVVDALGPLWATDLGDHYLGAVTNVFMTGHTGRGKMLGLSGDEVYFNSGVMLMNLAAWRRDGCTRMVHDYARRHADRLGWADQDAMNVLLGHRRLALHPRWNCMNSVLEFDSAVDVFGADAVSEARSDPGIRHFEGPSINKPWHYLCDHDMRELYLEHRRQTPWPDFRPEGVTAANVARRLLRRLRPARSR